MVLYWLNVFIIITTTYQCLLFLVCSPAVEIPCNRIKSISTPTEEMFSMSQETRVIQSPEAGPTGPLPLSYASPV